MVDFHCHCFLFIDLTVWLLLFVVHNLLFIAHVVDCLLLVVIDVVHGLFLVLLVGYCQ